MRVLEGIKKVDRRKKTNLINEHICKNHKWGITKTNLAVY